MTKGTDNHDYLTLMGGYALQERRRRRSRWARIRGWLLTSGNLWGLLLLIAVGIAFLAINADVFERWFWFGCPC